MKKGVFLLAFVLTCAPVLAQDVSQQDKMKTCNADAARKGLKGDERKAFMKNCLASRNDAKAEKKAVIPQQEKMKKCNADAGAKKLKGDQRKRFMSECLKA